MCSEVCGDVDNMDLGDTVEYTLSKGKGNKISAEKVTKVAAGMLLRLFICLALICFMQITQLCVSVNDVEEDVSNTVFLGRVVRPLRSVDPSQNDYQGLIEITEEGE